MVIFLTAAAVGALVGVALGAFILFALWVATFPPMDVEAWRAEFDRRIMENLYPEGPLGP